MSPDAHETATFATTPEPTPTVEAYPTGLASFWCGLAVLVWVCLPAVALIVWKAAL